MSLPMPKATGQSLRILSLDGGGVRGLSSLLILEGIMENIKESEGLSQVPSPCDMFDLIGGTGTGGIIAIMLGRLRMGVHESIQAYKHLADTIFVPEPSTTTPSSSAFSATKLEIAIKEMIRNNCCDPKCTRLRQSGAPVTDADMCPHEDILFRDENCTNTAVLAMTKVNLETSPTFLKTYHSSECFRGCKVWEVARATSAAVTFFDSIKLGRDQIEFIDASYGYNNPCEQLIGEAENQFPGRQMTVLSIGTGLGNVVEITDLRTSVLEAMSKMVTTSKHTDLRLRGRHIGTEVYHRFDVVNGLQDTEDSDRDKWSRIAAHTINYLSENKESVQRFMTAFTMGESSQPGVRHTVEDFKCLSDLHVTDPRTDKKNIEDTKGGLLKDCYKWVIEHNNFKQFLSTGESRILWIKGDPGKGKTMLLCGIINELEKNMSVALSYSFCQAADDRLNTATSVLRGLIYDLASRNPQLTKHIRTKYDLKGQSLFSNTNAWYDLCGIMSDILHDPSLSNAILIIDALDECSVKRKLLLELISIPSRAKWIVSSRNIPDIAEILDHSNQKFMIHLEVNQQSVSDAVNSYINFKVDQLARIKKYKDGTKDAVLTHLKLNANGTFLWVALICKELFDSSSISTLVKAKLKSFSPGLNPLYERMLEQILASDAAQLCQDVMAKALVVYRPMTLEELHALVDSLQPLEEEDVRQVITLCASFLTVHENVVSFVHQSAKEFILEKASGKLLPLGIQHQHYTVFVRSLEILHETLRRDIYGLKAPGCLISQVPVHEPSPLAPIRYFCTFWVDHLCDSATDEVASRNDKISAFFTEKYLQWLEALSLLRSISITGKKLERLVLFLKKAAPHLQDLVKDARRFLLSHGGVIEIAPLQVYVSALIFSPTGSLIRKAFTSEKPNWIDLMPKVEPEWDACLQTLEGHDYKVTSAVFSHDGQRLASGSEGKTFKIWDANSGACLRTIEAHDDSVTSVMFSHDGQQLVSGSFDRTVKTWNAISGACLLTIKAHNDYVTSAAFSNDGRRLASGSFDKTIKIWDATSGSCLQTLLGHQRQVTSVVFSNDGKQLASGSFDKQVNIWDATSGLHVRTLRGHQHPVTWVAFSSDGQLLATGSRDKTVKIWDLSSGVCQRTLRGHHGYVESVMFSYDGQQLTSASNDKTVKIWDANSGLCLRTLEGHSDEVISAVFSDDGQRLASGSRDKTVKIWDTTSGPRLQTSKTVWGHNSSVTSLAFSNDGQRLASGSKDTKILIWNATSGLHVRTLEGHHRQVTSVAFSHDGQLLESGSENDKFKIWDVTSGACRSVNGRGGLSTFVEFSNDAQQPSPGSPAGKVALLCSESNSYSISTDGVWIMKGKNDVLWLPPSYRPVVSAVVCSKVALGTESGRIVVIGFKSTCQHVQSH